MKELQYPFDSAYVLKNKRKIKRKLAGKQTLSNIIKIKIAILGGSTTHDIKEILELFLLDSGLRPEFYESEYGRYWEDGVFENKVLEDFCPEVIYIHTSSRNITQYPALGDSEDCISALLLEEYKRFEKMWEHLADTYHCVIIQNNFELPFYRLLGNKDASDLHGRVNFVCRLNLAFGQYAREHDNFYINDINYLASCYGLQKWADPFYWHMYKYALAVLAIPELAYNLSNIIKSIYGKTKKAFVLDLDNTLWGGIVGEDGSEELEIGYETPLGQLYSEFQDYLRLHKERGIMLNVCSKNDYPNALAGLNRPDNILKPDDFIVIKANWESKDMNIKEIARELNIGCDSIVFVDDSPAERHIVESQVPGVSVPELGGPESYIAILDRAGYFELTSFSEDDIKRNEMYKANMARKELETAYTSYDDYLKSLKMRAEITSFQSLYLSRIVQLTNKSNQFNLTTKRYTQAEIQEIFQCVNYLTLQGRLTDKFGDNGIVSVIIGHIKNNEAHIELWLMSCRVLKRNMEFAMMDQLVASCRKKDIKTIWGYYYPTSKNKMVGDLYEILGFKKQSQDGTGNTIWKFEVTDSYTYKNNVIEVEGLT